MPARKDLKSILILGSGPIVIGQGCEFDYSGTQACKVLKEEGYRVILVNSNPATIMTDPELADSTYIEPLSTRYLSKIIEKEKPSAILPTVGGQVALNAVLDLEKTGILEKYNIELIGAGSEAIRKAEDRELFKLAMDNVEKQTGLPTRMPRAGFANNLSEAKEILNDISLPLIIRPAFTLGGTGGGAVYNMEEFEDKVFAGLHASPISQILVEESVIGWKEFELEIMRDKNDNVVIICSIENIDPMGIHTGDSITVAPQQTLSDKEYQNLRDMSIAIIREIGVDTGGCNIQFAVNPENGKIFVIEMNPRVSRSSALASKATGFPIAKIAAKLAIGYTLDEIINDITGVTPACFEPSIDYVVTKIPRWDFAKFSGSDRILGTAMKAVGEAMAIGRTFKESFQKGLRSLEIDRFGFGSDGYFKELANIEKEGGLLSENFRAKLVYQLSHPSSTRNLYLKLAIEAGFDLDTLFQLTGIDAFFLNQFIDLYNMEKTFLADFSKNGWQRESFLEMKRNGFSDRQMAYLMQKKEILEIMKESCTIFSKKSRIQKMLSNQQIKIRKFKKEESIAPGFRQVDTCAGEFAATTPYLYSSYDGGDEAPPSNKEKVIVLGGGTNRIGQGIEFDYCCCHASFALKDMGYESIMVNSNPETVSTDYDTSDRLYFEPMTLEDVLAIVEREKPLGVIVQFGGQTPLKLAAKLQNYNVPILGTPVDAIDRAEDRKRFQELIIKLDLNQPPGEIVYRKEDSLEAAKKLGFPVLVRPSYVLGGRAMAIVRDESSLSDYLQKAEFISADQPILIDKFLDRAIELDVDALCDGESVYVAGIMEHIEEAGIHSGDSACITPPHTISKDMQEKIKDITKKLALELGVIGLMNIQFALKDETIYIIEVNPRASRTIPYISKATGIPLAWRALQVMMGKKLSELDLQKNNSPYYFVKEAVLPFKKFPGADTLLGPEMKSTGEVMGIGRTPAEAFSKAQEGANLTLPSKEEGKVFLSLNNTSKERLYKHVLKLAKTGYKIIATSGTAKFLKAKGIENIESVLKVHEGRPNIVDAIKSKEISLIINTPGDKLTRFDAFEIRQSALKYNIPYFTTSEATQMAVNSIVEEEDIKLEVFPLQNL